VDDREQERLRLTREVGKLLLHRSFRDALPPLREDGSRPFVVGLLEDTMGQILERVAALGGEAHLIVVMPTSTPGAERVQVLRVTGDDDKQLGDLDESRTRLWRCSWRRSRSISPSTSTPLRP
jgi:hypothetical protein